MATKRRRPRKSPAKSAKRITVTPGQLKALAALTAKAKRARKSK